MCFPPAREPGTHPQEAAWLEGGGELSWREVSCIDRVWARKHTPLLHALCSCPGARGLTAGPHLDLQPHREGASSAMPILQTEN